MPRAICQTVSQSGPHKSSTLLRDRRLGIKDYFKPSSLIEQG